MGRTARRPGPPSFLFGVWGQGETSKENIDALLSEFIEGLGEVTPRFLIPLDKEITSDTLLDVADWAMEKGHAVEVVEAAPVRTKVLREVKAEADKVHEADDGDNPIEKVFTEALIAKGEDARLLFLWAEEKGEPIEDDQRVLADVFDGGVVCLDLTQGLDVLNFDDAEEGEDGAADDGDAEPEPAADDGPDEATVRDFPIRRLRKHALEVAEARREAKEKGVPSDDEIGELNKVGLLAFLYGDADDDPGEKDGGAEADEGKGVSARRARQMREETEAEGKDTLAGEKRRGRAASKPSEPEKAPEDDAEGEDSPEFSEELLEAVATLFPDADGADGELEAIANAHRVIFAEFADVIIDRIAERVEKEPETSAVRKEIAPPRPPGKPRKDGATPTRRRTRA